MSETGAPREGAGLRPESANFLTRCLPIRYNPTKPQPERRDMVNEPEEEFEEGEVEEAPRRRPWALIIVCVVLAIVAAWTGTQWKLGVDREDKLRAELKKVYQEAEGLRTQTAQAQQKIAALEGQVASLAAEREGLTQRITELEKRLSPPKARRPAPAPRR